jgi:hypothetical protein
MVHRTGKRMRNTTMCHNMTVIGGRGEVCRSPYRIPRSLTHLGVIFQEGEEENGHIISAFANRRARNALSVYNVGRFVGRPAYTSRFEPCT